MCSSKNSFWEAVLTFHLGFVVVVVVVVIVAVVEIGSHSGSLADPERTMYIRRMVLNSGDLLPLPPKFWN